MSCLLGYVRSKFPTEILISVASVHLLWKFGSPSVASHWPAILNFAKLNPRSRSAKVKVEFKVDAVQKSFSRRFGNAAFFRVQKESRLVLHPEEGKRFRLVFLTAREMKREPKNFTCAIFRAVFDSRSPLSPKPHRNACYAGQLDT